MARMTTGLPSASCTTSSRSFSRSYDDPYADRRVAIAFLAYCLVQVPFPAGWHPLPVCNLSLSSSSVCHQQKCSCSVQTSWLTPSEIFTPYYGRMVANFVLDRHAQVAGAVAEPLRVFEIGGGTGTLARDILDHVRSAAPGVYDRMEYCAVEISPRLARLQAATVADNGGHGEHFRVR